MQESLLPESEDLSQSEHSVSDVKNRKIIFYIVGVVVIIFIFYFFLFSAPVSFPVGSVLQIESGMDLRDVSALLKKNQIIRSRVVFESFVVLFGGEKHIVSADYPLQNKLSVWQIAQRISTGSNRMAPVTLTIPEGFTVAQIADLATSKLTAFDTQEFLRGAMPLQGYLFPDTYFFSDHASAVDIIKAMSENFKNKITPILGEITASGKSEKQIIVMASIIEGEAKGDGDRGIISGILWKRIQIDMPLEVDAAPETYRTKGLPANPIDNPGLKAILAAIYPQSSPYLYYLHDKNGTIHYAETFAEHEANIKKYLQ